MFAHSPGSMKTKNALSVLKRSVRTKYSSQSFEKSQDAVPLTLKCPQISDDDTVQRDIASVVPAKFAHSQHSMKIKHALLLSKRSVKKKYLSQSCEKYQDVAPLTSQFPELSDEIVQREL